MNLAFFDNFKLGVVKGDAIHDVSAVVKDIPHVGPGDRFRHAGGQRPHPRAAAETRQYRLHGGELHGRRHAGETRADQRLP
jgi:hypothetical protein